MEFSGADIFDLLHGKGIVAALAGQGCGLGIVEAAQGNGAEKGKIVPHVEREAVEGHPVAHAHAERAQLAVVDPYTGAAFPAGGLDPERGGGADDDFFQRADETVQPVRALADAEHGVGYELARKMAGDVAAAICLDDFDAACLQFRPVEEQVLLAAVTSEGDHGRVLHQK